MSASKQRTLVDLSPLREVPAFARLWWGNLLSGLGAQMTIVAVGLQIYAISGDTFAVAMVSGLALLPMILSGPIGGMISDAFERRMVLIVSAILLLLSTAGLLVLSVIELLIHSSGVHVPLWLFYVCTTLSAVSGTVHGSARHASIPRVLPEHLVVKASALGGISLGVQVMVGPALAGVLVAISNYSFAFAFDLLLTATGFLGIISLPKIHVGEDATKPGLKSLRESFSFLKKFPQISAGFWVDIAAMTLGRPYVLFPAASAVVIGGGPITVGILTAAGAAGSFFTSAFSGRLVGIRKQGLAIANAVKVYGLFIAVIGFVLFIMQTGIFGRVGNSIDSANLVALVIVAICMFGTGATDEISAIFRVSMLQTVVPDELRGRIGGLFLAVVGGGPRLGDVFAGVMATLIGLWAGPVFGGIAIVLAMFVLLRLTPKFRDFVSD